MLTRSRNTPVRAPDLRMLRWLPPPRQTAIASLRKAHTYTAASRLSFPHANYAATTVQVSVNRRITRPESAHPSPRAAVTHSRPELRPSQPPTTPRVRQTSDSRPRSRLSVARAQASLCAVR
eukprot:scaffold91533_cov75-Phaeocystis_antarctica.AAC.2